MSSNSYFVSVFRGILARSFLLLNPRLTNHEQALTDLYRQRRALQMLLQGEEKETQKTNRIVQTQEPTGNAKKAIIFRLPAGVVHLICADIVHVSTQLQR